MVVNPAPKSKLRISTFPTFKKKTSSSSRTKNSPQNLQHLPSNKLPPPPDFFGLGSSKIPSWKNRTILLMATVAGHLGLAPTEGGAAELEAPTDQTVGA